MGYLQNDLQGEVLPEGKAVLEVRILEEATGEPLAGIRVVPSTSKQSSRWREEVTGFGGETDCVLSGRLGLAVLELRADRQWFVHVTDPTAKGVSEVVAAGVLEEGVRSRLRIYLPRGPRLAFHGVVTDARTKLPVGGAVVRMQVHRGGMNGRGERRYETDVLSEAESGTGGRFVLEMPERSFGLVLRADREGYSPFLAMAPESPPDGGDSYRVELQPAGSILVRLTSLPPDGALGLTARATVGSWAVLLPDPSSFLSVPDLTWSASFPAEGEVRIEDITCGVRVVLDILRDGSSIWRSGREIVIEADELAVVKVDLGAGATIRGSLVSSRADSVEGLEVWLLPGDGSAADLDPAKPLRLLDTWEEASVVDRQISGPDGRFDFEAVDHGVWRVGLAPRPPRQVLALPGRERAAPERAAPVYRVVRIDPSSTAVEVTLPVWRGLYVRGVVVGPDGLPIEGVTVSVGGESDRSGREGCFAVGPLSEGEHALTIRAMKAGFRYVRRLVRAGESGVEVQLARGATIRGAVIGTEGPLENAWVNLIQIEGESPSGGGGAASDASGHYVLSGLAPGTYRVRASDNQSLLGWSEPVRVDGLEERPGVDVQLREGVRLTIEGTIGERCALHFKTPDIDLGWAWPRDGGQPPVRVMPPGTCIVEEYDTRAKRVLRRLELTVHAGEDLVVNLDEQGEPVPAPESEGRD